MNGDGARGGREAAAAARNQGTRRPAPEDGVPFIRATGEPFVVGYQHGSARAAALRAFLGDHLARVGRLTPAPVSLPELRPSLGAYSAAIAAAAPRLSEEIDGLALGAGIPRELAVLLQVRREIIGYQRMPSRGSSGGTGAGRDSSGDCTTYASLSAGPGGSPVLAQTVDLSGDLDDQIAVVDVGLSGSRRRAMVLSFGGLLGYLGVNTDGLAIGLNLVLGGDWHPGLPPYLAIRHVLDNASCVAEAVPLLQSLPLASSRSLTLCDTTTALAVEILGGTVRVVADDLHLVHTNHFLHPDFVSRDQLNVFARNSSLLRLRAATAGLSGLTEAGSGAEVEEHFALLAQPPICVADTGDIRREKTVAAVVLLPAQGELHLRPGDPSASATQVFRLRPPPPGRVPAPQHRCPGRAPAPGGPGRVPAPGGPGRAPSARAAGGEE
jgi:isopenicillin-N N-acyltransferase like protein